MTLLQIIKQRLAAELNLQDQGLSGWEQKPEMIRSNQRNQPTKSFTATKRFSKTMSFGKGSWTSFS